MESDDIFDNDDQKQTKWIVIGVIVVIIIALILVAIYVVVYQPQGLFAQDSSSTPKITNNFGSSFGTSATSNPLVENIFVAKLPAPNQGLAFITGGGPLPLAYYCYNGDASSCTNTSATFTGGIDAGGNTVTIKMVGVYYVICTIAVATLSGGPVISPQNNVYGASVSYTQTGNPAAVTVCSVQSVMPLNQRTYEKDVLVFGSLRCEGMFQLTTGELSAVLSVQPIVILDPAAPATFVLESLLLTIFQIG